MAQSPIQTASMGILQSSSAEQRFQLHRYPPSAPLAPFVKHYWLVSWDLREVGEYHQDVIPNPCVNLVVEQSGAAVYGVASRKYTKHLTGAGKAFGVKFKPGGFYPYAKKPISLLTDSSMGLLDAFQEGNDELGRVLNSSGEPDQLILCAEQLLLRRLPDADPAVDYVNTIIDYIQTNRNITKVEQLCDDFQVHIRKLQRLFDKYVGVSPKWVIQLYRLQNAAERLDRGGSEDWTKLSLELGYFDQSHFIKAFKSMIGVTPEMYNAAGGK